MMPIRQHLPPIWQYPIPTALTSAARKNVEHDSARKIRRSKIAEKESTIAQSRRYSSDFTNRACSSDLRAENSDPCKQ
jgi:hypothetical protein